MKIKGPDLWQMSPPTSLAGLAFLSLDLVWDEASVLEQSRPKRSQAGGENGAISWSARTQGSVSWSQEGSRPRAKKKNVSGKSSPPNPRFQRVYFTTIIC